MKIPPTGATPLDGLSEFCAEWGRIHSSASESSVPDCPVDLAPRLEHFFSAWRQLAEPLEPGLPPSATDWAERAPQMADFFRKLGPALRNQTAQRRRGDAINVWEVSHLGRDELRNSKLLAWLLDRHGSHGQGPDLLAALLDRIARHMNGPLGKQAIALPYRTGVESCPLGEKDDRVDIEIDGDGLLLFIEVKIDAPETARQLDRYLNIAKVKARGRPWGLVYLTRHGQLPARYTGSRAHPGLIPVDWPAMAEIIERHTETLPDCFARAVLRQYAAHVRAF